MFSSIFRGPILHKKYPNIVIMRHGETNYNNDPDGKGKRVQGQSASSSIMLTEEGRQEILNKLGGIKLPDLLICSPLLRCRQTAEAWAKVSFNNIPVKKMIVEGLMEVDVGELEGFYFDELVKHDKYGKLWQLWKQSPLTFPGFPGGEDLQGFQSRILKTFSSLCEKFANEPVDDICIITHGGSMRILKCFLKKQDLSHLWDEKIQNIERYTLTEANIDQLIHYSKANLPIKYYNQSYPPDHWALHMPNEKDDNFIMILEINEVRIALKLNPTDARGYRGIAVLVAKSPDEMEATFNREYTANEEVAFNTAVAIFSKAYKKHGLIVQTSIAGNNSQSINEDGSVQMGNEREPSLLHGHVIGRGNPNKAYIAGVMLKGVEPGKEFNLRGDGQDEGNKRKEKWETRELELVATELATAIVKIIQAKSQKESFKNIKIISINKNCHNLLEGLVTSDNQAASAHHTQMSMTPSLK